MEKPTIYFVSNYKVEGINNYATVKDCYNYLKTKTIIGIDIETSAKSPEIFKEFRRNKQFRPGLDPYLTKIVMLQLGDFEKIFVIDVRCFSKEELKPLINLLNYNKDLTLIGQNLKFEQKHLKFNYGINFYKVKDIMIQEMCLYNGLTRSYSLAGMAKEYLGVKSVNDFSLFDLESKSTLDDEILLNNDYLLTPFEVADEEIIDKGTRMEFVTIYDKPFTEKQILYGSDDILYPLLISERQELGRILPNKEVYKPIKLFDLENKMVLVNADMELNGMPFKEEIWKDIENKKHKEYLERLNILNSYIEQLYPKFVEEPNLFNFHRRCIIEWGSSKQVIELFRYLDICPKEFSKQTKKLDWTVGAVALLKSIPNELKDAYNNQQWIGFELDKNGLYIEDHSKLILAYLLMKRSEQAVTTFGLEWLKYVHPVTGRIHSNFRQILNSGRMASNNPNIQNLPTGKYRDAFAVDSGSVISSDFGNQEMRTAACISGENVMLEVFTKGHKIYEDDLHMATADAMNKALHPGADYLPKKGDKKFTNDIKKQRDRAKIVNFGILYGKEAKGFAQDFGMELIDAEEFIKNYFKAYPKLQLLMEEQAKKTFKNNYILINSITDRRWFSNLFEEMEEFRKKASSFFPEEYFTNKMPKEKKALLKEELNSLYPEIKEYWRGFFGIKGRIQRKSTNYLIQGTAADQTKNALVMIRKNFIEKNKHLKLINSVHDEILIESTNEPKNAQNDANLLAELMVKGANEFLNPKIMTSNPEIGKCWVH